MKPIALVDPAGSVARDRDRYLAVITELIDRGAFVGGDAVSSFEEAFARSVGVAHAVAVSSGTEALVLSFRALGLGPGDEVLTAASSFFATAEAIALCGATPVLCDVREDTLTLDVDDVARRLGPRSRAVVPVHLYGQLAELDAVLALAKDRKLVVIEDAAQAHGATLLGRDGQLHRAGASGAAGCFSFYPSKNLAALGEGGAVTTHDKELADRVRALRDHGQTERHVHAMIGTNARLNAITCAGLSIALSKRLEADNRRRRELARAYEQRLAGRAGVRLVATLPGAAPVHHLMVVRVDPGARSRIAAALARQGIATAVHYPRPIHLQPAFRALGQGEGSCPVAERAAHEVLSLPMHPGLTLEDVDRVADALLAALAG